MPLLLLQADSHLLRGMLAHIELVFDFVGQIGRVIGAGSARIATHSSNHLTAEEASATLEVQRVAVLLS